MEVLKNCWNKISIVSQASAKDEALNTKVSMNLELPESGPWLDMELALYHDVLKITAGARRELVSKHGHTKSKRGKLKHLGTTVTFPDMDKNLPFIIFHCLHHFKIFTGTMEKDDVSSFVESSGLNSPETSRRSSFLGFQGDREMDFQVEPRLFGHRPLSLQLYFDQNGASNQNFSRNSANLDSTYN